MSNDLPPSGARFASRKDPLNSQKEQWCLKDKKSGKDLTEYRSTKSTAKKDYFNKYKNGHEDRAHDV